METFASPNFTCEIFVPLRPNYLNLSTRKIDHFESDLKQARKTFAFIDVVVEIIFGLKFLQTSLTFIFICAVFIIWAKGKYKSMNGLKLNKKNFEPQNIPYFYMY